VYEGRQKDLHAREAELDKHRQQLHEQTKQFEEMLAHLSTVTPTDMTPLHQQVSAITVGDKDVESARRRFAGLQKVAQDAQQKVKEEE
jgi:hypothetical protein